MPERIEVLGIELDSTCAKHAYGFGGPNHNKPAWVMGAGPICNSNHVFWLGNAKPRLGNANTELS